MQADRPMVPARWPVERKRRCASAPGVPHGVGHNRVCVCQCAWCVAERGESDAQLALPLDKPCPPV